MIYKQGFLLPDLSHLLLRTVKEFPLLHPAFANTAQVSVRASRCVTLYFSSKADDEDTRVLHHADLCPAANQSDP